MNIKSNIFKQQIKRPKSQQQSKKKPFNNYGIQPQNKISGTKNKKFNIRHNSTNHKIQINNKPLIIKKNNFNNFYINQIFNGENIIRNRMNNFLPNIEIGKKFNNFNKANKNDFLRNNQINLFNIRNKNNEKPIKFSYNFENKKKIDKSNNLEIRTNSHSSSKKSYANGLVNVGATCYMNATIQCLAHVRPLTNYLLKFNPNNNKYKLTRAYKEVLINIWENRNIKEYSPNNFKRVISEMNPLFEGIQANDSKDLILFLMETLHGELNEIKNNIIEQNINPNQYNYKITFDLFCIYFSNNYNSIISNLFYGMYNSLMQCLNCKIITHNIQCFNILIFPLEEVRKFTNKIGNIVNIYECFEYNQKDDYILGENQIFCKNCRMMTNSINKVKLIICPNILVINLNRGKGLQFDVKLYFEEYLNIKNYVYYAKSPSFYELIGIVTHFGPSSMGGHYIAFCKSFVDLKWYKYNDSTVTESSFEEARNTGVPYILFYSYIKG